MVYGGSSAQSPSENAVVNAMGRGFLPLQLTGPVFANPSGVYNSFLGMYQKPPGCTFNGRVWVRDNPPISSPTPEAAASSISSDKRTQVLYTTPSDRQERPSNEDERDVKRPTSEDGQPRRVEYQNASSSRGWPPYARSAPRAGPDDPDAISYACFRRGHIAEHCTDRAAKAKNDTYLARRRPARGYEEQGNNRRPQQRESYGPDQRYPEPQSRCLDASTTRYGPRPNLSQPPPPQRRRGQSLDRPRDQNSSERRQE